MYNKLKASHDALEDIADEECVRRLREAHMNSYKFRKIALVTAGTIAVVLGCVGIIIPVLPTTPFLILACFCYMRSSEKLYNKLMNHKVFGTYIYNYVTYRSITKKTKILSIILLWSGLILSILLIAHLHIRLVLLAVGIGVTVHLLHLRTMPTKKEERTSTSELEEHIE